MKKIIKANSKKLQVVKKEPGYEEDFYAWSFEQAKHIKKKEFNMLDFENLVEEIESLGISQRDKLESSLATLLMHMLKYDYQIDRRSKSWQLSIRNSRNLANKTLSKNPSLKHKLKILFTEAYETARLNAAIETNLELEIFPEECPWTIKEVLGE